MIRSFFMVLMTTALLSATSQSASAVKIGDVDDFQDFTLNGWFEPQQSSNPPTLAQNGQDGPNDFFMRDESRGGVGAGSRMAVLNRSQWTGDLLAAGIARVQIDMVNLGQNDMFMRIAFQDTSFTRYASSAAEFLPADGQWRTFTFGLDAESLTRDTQQNTTPLVKALSQVFEFRMISQESDDPFEIFKANPLKATLGVDNITALGAAAPPRRVGDATNDNVVDRADAAVVAQNLGTQTGNSFDAGDFDENNIVSLVDLSLVQANLDPVGQSPLSVPEPDAAWLALAALLTLLVFHARRRPPVLCRAVVRKEREGREERNHG